MLASFAASMAVRRRALPAGSPPPARAATVISRMSFVKREPLAAPWASFFRLILDPRLWPDTGHLPEDRVHDLVDLVAEPVDPVGLGEEPVGAGLLGDL